MEPRDPLLEMLRERSYRCGTFTLSSGRQSDFFIDCKTTVLTAAGHALVGPALLKAIRNFESSVAVAGVVLGGCSLASAVAMASHLNGPALDAVFVRKSTKEHGSKSKLEGAGHLPEGAHLTLVEDTTTTGGSTLRAADELKRSGFRVVGVVAVVDRLEGAREAFEAAGLPFTALYSRNDFTSS